MKWKTGITVLSANAVLVLLVGQAVRGEAPAEVPAPLSLVEASVTVPEAGDPVVVEGALSSNTRGWSHVSGAAVGATQNGIRSEVVDAYSLAVAASPAGCHLSVSVLAAIGQVESGNLVGHGLDAEHRAVPAITGPVLDGKKFAAIEDTDDGLLDGDNQWDRAVGPMQFVPASWRVAGVDMDGDGRRDPQDVDDAAGTAMVYLCAGGRDLGTSDGLREAVLSYNHSSAYLRLVLGWTTAFDRDPLAGWAAMPLLDAWERTPDIPATLPAPTAVAQPRTPARAPTAAAPGTAVARTSTASPTASTTATTPAPIRGGPPRGAAATPTVPARSPSLPAAPATEPDPTPAAEPDPTPEPLPTCPVPSPTDPSGTLTTAPAPADTPHDDAPGTNATGTNTTSTADIPGDGTDQPVECLLPIDPETGRPMTPAPEADPSTGPEPGTGG
jgi:hypothetical protein